MASEYLDILLKKKDKIFRMNNRQNKLDMRQTKCNGIPDILDK